MNTQILNTLRNHAQSELDVAALNVNIYLNSSTGIGEHSDIAQSIQTQLDSMAAAQGRLDAIDHLLNQSIEGVFNELT